MTHQEHEKIQWLYMQSRWRRFLYYFSNEQPTRDLTPDEDQKMRAALRASSEQLAPKTVSYNPDELRPDEIALRKKIEHEIKNSETYRQQMMDAVRHGDT